MTPFIIFYLMAPKILKQKEEMFLRLFFPNWFFKLMKYVNMSQCQERTADAHPRHACRRKGTLTTATHGGPSPGSSASRSH